MGGSVSINGQLVKISAIAALKPYDEMLLDPCHVTHQAELQVWVSMYNSKPVHARRSLKQLASELKFPVFQSHHPIALNPEFGHYKIEAYDPQTHGPERLPGTQSIISWKSQYGERRILLRHPVEEVISQLPKLAQRVEAAATRPPCTGFKSARPSIDN